MGEAVDGPDDVDAAGVPQYGGHAERVQPGLAPEVHGDDGRQHETEDRHHLHVMSGDNKTYWCSSMGQIIFVAL